MKTTINEHGEKVTVIGTINNSSGGRTDVVITEFVSCGLPCFALTGGAGGYPDARRFSTQVKRAKVYFGHESLNAEWHI